MRLRRKRNHRRPPLIPIVFLVIVLGAAIAPSILHGIDPYTGQLGEALKPPAWRAAGSLRHVLGTDQLGRDVLARLVGGARLTMFIAISAVGLSVLIGTSIGLISGYFRGWIDVICMRVTDALIAIPTFILGLALATSLGPGTLNVVAVAAATSWAYVARVIRGEVLHLRTMDFIEAAEVTGVPRRRIIFKHLLPNVAGPLLVMATLQVGEIVILAASLSFLGLGVPSPKPEWGLMLADARGYLDVDPLLVIAPAICIGATILSSNILGDWLRDRLDPHSLLAQSLGEQVSRVASEPARAIATGEGGVGE